MKALTALLVALAGFSSALSRADNLDCNETCAEVQQTMLAVQYGVSDFYSETQVEAVANQYHKHISILDQLDSGDLIPAAYEHRSSKFYLNSDAWIGATVEERVEAVSHITRVLNSDAKIKKSRRKRSANDQVLPFCKTTPPKNWPMCGWND